MSKEKLPSQSVADENTDSNTEKNTGQKKSQRKAFYFVVFPILLLIIGITSYGGFLYNKASSVMDQSYEPIEREVTKHSATEKENIDDLSILILGVDDNEVRNYQGGSRTDAMILATFNQEQKSIKLLSIPRDTRVYYEDRGYFSKINHAHAWGGVKSTVEMTENLLDMPIDHYVKVNFNAFMEIVEAVGGVAVNVPYEVKELDSRDRKKKIHLMPGFQTLNGEEALAFVRMRKLDSDVERGKRQQEMIAAILKKSMAVSSITKYADIIDAVGDNMTTDIPFSQMKSFVDYAVAGTNLDIETLTLKGNDTYIDGIYYYELDEIALLETQGTLKRHVGIIPATENPSSNAYVHPTNPPGPVSDGDKQEFR